MGKTYPGCHKVPSALTEFEKYFLEPAPDNLHPPKIRSKRERKVERNSEKINTE